MRNSLIGLWIVPVLLAPILIEANMNITLYPLDACATATELKVGDICVFEMIIRVPVSNATMMHVELFTSDNSSIMIAQLCKPTITIGSNYNIAKAPIPVLSSSFENYQFDQAIIDFGVITNSGSSATEEANLIKIVFNVVIIQNSEPDGSNIWITAGAEYFEGNEIWIGQTNYTYRTDTDNSSPTPSQTFLPTSSSANTEIGKFGTFETRLTIENPRVVNLSLSAESSDYVNNSITVCSIHIKSAGWCFNCLDSTKAYLGSKYSKEKNLVNLNLGNIVNVGINNGNQSGNSYIDILVAYKVLDWATEADTSQITLMAIVNGVSASFVHSITVSAAGSATIASVPTVTTLGINNPVSIYQAFNITLIIEFPQDYNNYLEVESIPIHDSNDGLPRAKVCSAVVTSSGENLPCPKCMNNAKLNQFSLNSSLYSTHDGMTWSLGSVLNYNLRTTDDNLDVNKITLSVIGQVLFHPNNIEGSNISIPIGITFGNQTIWVSDNTIVIAGGANFSSANESLPTFSISAADRETYTAMVKEPRAIYFDIYTKPGSVYQEMDIEILMPETALGSLIPAATVCSVKLYYVGIYSTCAQKNFINNPSNNQISYLQRMIKFKNDKAIVKLPALCNSADNSITMDPIDGLVRFLIYFQLDDDPNVPTSNYISVGTKFTSDQIYIGSIEYTKSNLLPTSQATGVYSFTNLTNIATTGSEFASANLIVKIPPSSLFGYNFEASLTSSLATGDATFCTIRILKQGNSVPCTSPLKHSFQYSNDLVKNYDFALAGPICSINNISSSVNNLNEWDEDSVSFQILTRPSYEASGTYTVDLVFKDQFSNITLSTNTYTFTSASSSAPLDTPNSDLTNSSIFGVNPEDHRYVFVNSDYTTFYKGQTSIIRFNLTINEPKSFNIELTISSTQIDKVEVIRLYTIHMGDNFPCNSMYSKATYTNGTIYPHEIKINIGNVAYYAIDPNNMTSSTIFFEAQVRIPISSSLAPGSTTNLSLKPSLNSNEHSFLSKDLVVSVKDAAELVSNVSALYSLNFTQGPQQVSIRQSIRLNISLLIPPYSNCQTKIFFSCVDQATKRQFCHINSVKVVSFGQNVDGLQNEYFNNLILAEFNKSALTYYNDTANLDLGIVTNTHYTQKVNNYNTNDDLINLEADILVTDDQIAVQNTNFNFMVNLDLNSGQQIISSDQILTIQRSQTERPYLTANASFLNDTTTIINSNSKLSVKFEVEHEVSSNAEAYNVSVKFFLPTYISFLEEQNCSFSASLNESTIIFAVDRLHFGQKVTCLFNLVFDQSNQYGNLMNQFGKSPSTLKIPYVILYQKYARAGDTETKFNSNFSSIQFRPPSVPITSVPNNKLKSSLGDAECRMTSSVPEVSNIYSSGWKFGYRSYHWLKSLGSFVTISFVNKARISKIDLSQLVDDGTVTPFNQFRLAYSDDNSTFAHLPFIQTNTALGQNFSYEMPNKFIECRYLRIYITDVTNRADLKTKKTGLVINEIYGEFTPSTIACPVPAQSVDYASRSYLYVDSTSKIYVCDETNDRKSSECYSSSDGNPAEWMVMSKIVSTVVFYVKELSSGREFLYGISKDKKGFVRSDDGGLIWKIVSQREYDEMNNNAKGSSLYQGKYYNNIGLIGPNLINEGSWTFSVEGVLFGGTIRFDWFN